MFEVATASIWLRLVPPSPPFLMIPSYYLVRAMGQSEAEYAIFFDTGRVAVGWRDVDLSAFGDPERAVAAVEEAYYADGQTAPTVVGRKRHEVRRFLAMREGDRLIVPHGKTIRLGVVDSGPFYESGAFDADLANQRRARYLRTVSRAELSEGFQRYLRSRGAGVRDLEAFRTELDRLFEGGRGADADAERETEAQEEFKTELLRRIQSGETFLPSGGRGLEGLVAGLLRMDGYATSIPAKSAQFSLRAGITPNATTRFMAPWDREGSPGLVRSRQKIADVRDMPPAAAPRKHTLLV